MTRAWGYGAQTRGMLPFFQGWLLFGGERWKGLEKYPEITIIQDRQARPCSISWGKAASLCRWDSRHYFPCTCVLTSGLSLTADLTAALLSALRAFILCQHLLS